MKNTKRFERLQELSKISTDDLAPKDERRIIEYVDKHRKKAIDARSEEHLLVPSTHTKIDTIEPDKGVSDWAVDNLPPRNSESEESSKS